MAQQRRYTSDLPYVLKEIRQKPADFILDIGNFIHAELVLKLLQKVVISNNCVICCFTCSFRRHFRV